MAYAVIRSHARIADLLKPDLIQKLVKSGSIEAFTKLLSDTPYGEIKFESSAYTSIALEKVFYIKFIERMSQIVNIVPKKIGEFLHAYFYLRFEVQNLKRILRGKFSDLSVDQIKDYLIPIEPYHVNNYDVLVKSQSLSETVKLLQDTPYSPIAISLEYCIKNEVIWPLEQALNHIYVMTMLESLSILSKQDRTLVKNILKFEINVENLLNAIKERRTRGVGREIQNLQEFFPVTFDIDLEMIKSLIEAENLRVAIAELGDPYNDILIPIYEGDVALIRARVRRHIYSIVLNARARNDFGLNVILAYLIFSELEKDDLVGIAWGLTQEIPPEEMTKYLAISMYGSKN